MKDKPVDGGNVSISLENTMRLLEENANSDVREYFFAVYDFLEDAERRSHALHAENIVLKDTIQILKDVIQALTRQHKDKGEKEC